MHCGTPTNTCILVLCTYVAACKGCAAWCAHSTASACAHGLPWSCVVNVRVCAHVHCTQYWLLKAERELFGVLGGPWEQMPPILLGGSDAAVHPQLPPAPASQPQPHASAHAAEAPGSQQALQAQQAQQQQQQQQHQDQQGQQQPQQQPLLLEPPPVQPSGGDHMDVDAPAPPLPQQQPEQEQQAAGGMDVEEQALQVPLQAQEAQEGAAVDHGEGGEGGKQEPPHQPAVPEPHLGALSWRQEWLACVRGCTTVRLLVRACAYKRASVRACVRVCV